MSLGQSRGFGSGVVYGITIVPLLATLGFYFLEHVPSRGEYILNLRFRTLGVIGKQIETKLAAVSSGLTYGRSIPKIDQAVADGPARRVSLEEYVSRVFPGLQPPEGRTAVTRKAPETAEAAIDPDIEFLLSADRVRFTVSPAEQKWEDSLARLIRPLTEDASFDDVLLTDQKGVVLFQRSDSTPRVRDVSALLKKPDPKDSSALQFFHRLHSEGSGFDTDLLRDVDLDGSGYRFLTQPLTIRVPRSPDGKVKELLLCGLIRSDAIQREAMHVPPKYLLWIIVPLFAGVLSGPLLKLVLIRRTGRFETRDIPMLALFSCLTMAMLTVVLLSYHLSKSYSAHLEQSSQGLANRLTAQVLECFKRGREALQQADAFAAGLDAAKPSPLAMNRTRMWSWAELVKQAPAVTETNLEFIFWTGADGSQIEKWTPLETNTPFYPQQDTNTYRQAVAGQFWRARSNPDSPFTVELLVSPTTSTPITVLTMPSKRAAGLTLGADRKSIDPSLPSSLKPAFVSVVETPRNLLSPVIPPATGFALVRNDGSVLYHSDHDRILNENLFRETENFRALRDAVTTQHEGRVDGRYRGSNVAFYVRPIREVSGIPWTIVVFREIEPWQTLVWQVGLDVLLLYLLLWAVPVFAVPATLLSVKWRKQTTWNACRIAMLRDFWPKENSAVCYRTVAVMEGGLIVVFLALLAWFGMQPDGAAGTVLLISGLFLPGVALLVWAWQVRHLPAVQQSSDSGYTPQGAERRSRWRPLYIGALCLTLVSSSVLPVTAFFHLAFRMESDIDTRHWQGDLAARVLKHRATIESEIREPGRLAPDGVALAMSLALPSASGLCDSERLYESWADTTVHCGITAPPGAPNSSGAPSTPPWMKALHALRVRAVGLEHGVIEVGRSDGVTRAGVSRPSLTISRAGAPDLVVQSKLWDLAILPASLAWWIFMAILLGAGCVWVWAAASRLFLFQFHEIPLRTLEQLGRFDLNHPILVLGLPRSGKDGAVREFIERVEAEPDQNGALPEPPRVAVQARVDLKDDNLDEAWLKRVLHDIDLETFAAPPDVDLRPVRSSQEAPPANPVTLAAVAVAGGGGNAPATIDVPPPQPMAGDESAGQPAPPGCRVPDYLHVTNLEAAIQDRVRRDTTMRLLDILVRAHGTGRTKLVVTSVVDPMLHFDIIFPDQNAAVERSHLPETEFGRWAHVFLQFERVLVHEKQTEVEAAESACRRGSWGDELWEECRPHRSLRRYGELITEAVEQRIKVGQPPPGHEQLIDELYEKALALYKLLWSACTRPEKLLLVQLAQTGLVNPICKDTLHDLIRKRLVVLKPYPSIMNESFTRFLQSAATTEQILAWEKEAGESHWQTVRNVLIIMVVFTMLMIGVSQDHALQSISGILTAVVGGIGGVFKLAETISSKLARRSNSAPAADPA